MSQLGPEKDQLDFLREPIARRVGHKFASLQTDSPLRPKHNAIELLFYGHLEKVRRKFDRKTALL